MLRKRERKVVSTVHLYQRQLRRLDALARQTGHSRAQALRDVVETGLAAMREGRGLQRRESGLRKRARERLLRMGDGYGASGVADIRRLDEELYGDA